MILPLALTSQSASAGPLRGVLFVMMGVSLLIAIGIVGMAFMAHRQSVEDLLTPPKPKDPRSATSTASRKEGDGAVTARRQGPAQAGGDHLLVSLSDGRSIEGWMRKDVPSDKALLLLDVVGAYDASGNAASVSRSDSFILRDEVESIRRIED